MVSGVPKTIASSLHISSLLVAPTSMNMLDKENNKMCSCISNHWCHKFQKMPIFTLLFFFKSRIRLFPCLCSLTAIEISLFSLFVFSHNN